MHIIQMQPSSLRGSAGLLAHNAEDQGISICQNLLIVWGLVTEKCADGFKGHRSRRHFIACRHTRIISLMSTQPEVSTQFTEDVFAKKDHYCERPKCKALIRQGEPEFYIATIEPGQRGRVVCGNCNQHYLRKPSTTVRRTGVFYITKVNLIY